MEDIKSLPEGGHLKYDLLEEIGQGTYGLVHRAVETGKTSQFAVKIIEDFEENWPSTGSSWSTASTPTFPCCPGPTGVTTLSGA